jgi:hypothetical protein
MKIEGLFCLIVFSRCDFCLDIGSLSTRYTASTFRKFQNSVLISGRIYL